MNCPECQSGGVQQVWAGGSKVRNRFKCLKCGRRFKCIKSESSTPTLVKFTHDSPPESLLRASNDTSIPEGSSNLKSQFAEWEWEIILFMMKLCKEQMGGVSERADRRMAEIIRKLEMLKGE